MENKTNSTNDTAESWDADLTCWRTATNPLCLRIETTSETYLFAYGYLQRAKLSRQGDKEAIEICFQDTMVIVRGTGLKPLCDALARLGVERITICPDKYGAASIGGVVADIEIRQMQKGNQE